MDSRLGTFLLSRGQQLFRGLVFGILCFIHVFVQQPGAAEDRENHVIITTGNSSEIIDAGDDYLRPSQYDPFLRQAAISALIICLIPGADTLLDCILPSWLGSDLMDEAKTPQFEHNTNSTVRLSLSERIMFIIGTVCFCSISFPAMIDSGENYSMIYIGFGNCSTIFTIVPVLSLLNRYCTVMNSFWTTVLQLLVCMASFLGSVAVTVDSASPAYADINLAASWCIGIAAIIFTVICIYCFVQTVFWYRERSAFFAIDSTLKTSDSLKHKEVDMRTYNEERFHNFVLGTHMLTAYINITLNSVWYWYSQTLPPETLSMLIYVVVATSAIIFIVELRVRKNDTLRTLMQLLETKKDYVR
jgi:hypothetical protein